MLKKLNTEFIKIFGEKKTRNFFAPGRVNLIGEHTDYNGGHVFPCALSFGTYGVCSPRTDNLVRLYSVNFADLGVIEFTTNDLENVKKDSWTNYAKGVISEFLKAGYEISSGFEAVIEGNIPNGSGLSSSASVELLISVMLKGLNNLQIEPIEMVKLSQKAENNFVGVNCGIMDQFAIGMGKAKSAILLDCNTLKFEYAPVDLKDASIIIANTNKRRELGESKYNERRSECESALTKLQKQLSIRSLGELSAEQFEKNKNLIADEIQIKRARHAVMENLRTLQAADELKNGNIAAFGKLMNESHLSLRDDYDVTGRELDVMVEAAWQEEGVIGSRMTGAGFGGCTVSIVKNDNIESFIENVGNRYFEKTSLKADFYRVDIGNGAGEL